MGFLQHMASCSPKGELRLTQDAFNEICWMTLCELDFISDGMERIRVYLSLANFCNEVFMDREARDYYEVVLEETIRDGVVIEEFREQAEYAYQKYVGLVSSDDDYVWETVSQRIEQYRPLFEKSLKKLNKRNYE